MKKIILLHAIICLLCYTVAAQETSKRSLGKYRITTQPTQLLANEITMNAERIIGKRTIGIFAAYRYPGDLLLLPADFFDSDETSYLGYLYKGVTAGINSKRYFSDKGGWYIEGQLFFRYWWNIDHYNYNQPNGDYIEITHKRTIKVYGSKFLLGYTTSIGRHGSVRPVIGFYGGIGLRLKEYEHQNLIKINGSKQPDAVSTDFKLRPSLQLGFNLGIEIFKKPVQKVEE